MAITKTAPEKVNRCDVIKLQYTVRNDGTGDVGAFKVVDQLGESIKTIDGNDQLEFTVDSLTAGEERKFLGRVFATEIGSFGSRAKAMAENSDLKSQSKETQTDVVAADLAVELTGPQQLLDAQPATFVAKVTNNGNATVSKVDVRVSYPSDAELVSVSDMQMTQSDSKPASRGGQNPTYASQEKSAQSSHREGQSVDQDVN